MNTLIISFFVLLHVSNVCALDYYRANVAAAFSKTTNINRDLCNAISSETGNIYIMASKFSSNVLKNCIVNLIATDRRVFLLIDSKYFDKNSKAIRTLSSSEICVYVDSIHNTFHNKVILAGTDFVFTGSYNFSDEAEYQNAENAVFIRSPEIYKAYKHEFSKHLYHSAMLKIKNALSEKCQPYEEN